MIGRSYRVYLDYALRTCQRSTSGKGQCLILL